MTLASAPEETRSWIAERTAGAPPGPSSRPRRPVRDAAENRLPSLSAPFATDLTSHAASNVSDTRAHEDTAARPRDARMFSARREAGAGGQWPPLGRLPDRVTAFRSILGCRVFSETLVKQRKVTFTPTTRGAMRPPAPEGPPGAPPPGYQMMYLMPDGRMMPAHGMPPAMMMGSPHGAPPRPPMHAPGWGAPPPAWGAAPGQPWGAQHPPPQQHFQPYPGVPPAPAAFGRAPAAPRSGRRLPPAARIAGAGPADAEFPRGRRRCGARSWSARGIHRRPTTSGELFQHSDEHSRFLRPRPRRRPRVGGGFGRGRADAEIEKGQERLESVETRRRRRHLPDGG